MGNGGSQTAGDPVRTFGKPEAEPGTVLKDFHSRINRSSTSNRAYETALPLAEMTHKPVEQMEFCHEDLAWWDLAVEREVGGKT